MFPLIVKPYGDLEENKLHGVVLVCDIMMDDVLTGLPGHLKAGICKTKHIVQRNITQIKGTQCSIMVSAV